jgi:hypothetical protein
VSSGGLLLKGLTKEDGKMNIEHRQTKRNPISVAVSFPDPAEISAEKKKVLKGTSADFSPSGLGIFSHIELKPDTMLEIECRDIWDNPKKFSVQWCNKVIFNFYRVGLEAKNGS